MSISNDESLIFYLATILKTNIFKMCMNQNSCHVIQKCLGCWNESKKRFIYEIVRENSFEICKNRWGCCIYQRCMDYADDVNKLRLAQSINSYLFDLIQDPYGNYVIQFILDLEVEILVNSIVDYLTISENCESFYSLCCQKFSSNVIEKCIRVSSRCQRNKLIEMIMQKVDFLLEDAFGNYVLQTALDFSDEMQRNCLYNLINKKMIDIQHMPHGKKLFSKICG